MGEGGGGQGKEGVEIKQTFFGHGYRWDFPPGEMAGVSEAFSILYLSGSKAISHFHPCSKRGPGTPR